MGRPRSRAVRATSFEAGGVYVAELTNGVVKVGRATNIRNRLHSLSDFVRRALCVDIARVEVFAPRGSGSRAERLALQEVGRRALLIEGRREFFTGITFDDAVRIVREVSEAA